MTRLTTTALLVLIMAALPLVASASTECEPVFRDLCFGDPVSKLGDVTFIGNLAGVPTYAKVGEDLSLGSISLDYIYYSFFGNKLMTVAFASKDVEKLRDALSAKYGEPSKSNALFKDASWLLGDLFVRLDHQTITDNAMVMLVSQTLAEQHQESQREQARRDAEAW